MTENEASDATRRIFLGREDPSRISLEIVFPYGDIVFSTPVNEVGRFRKVVIEGHETILDFLEPHLQHLVKFGSDEREYGEWMAVAPFDPMPVEGIQILFRPINKNVAPMMILPLLLREHLVQVCDLKLSPISQLLGKKDDIIFLSQLVKLPEEIGNGKIDVPAPLTISKRINAKKLN